MDMEPLMKYLMWIAFFILASAGIYLLLKRLGIM
jgi:hypothetical protein